MVIIFNVIGVSFFFTLQGNELLVGAINPNQKEGNVQIFDMVAT